MCMSLVVLHPFRLSWYWASQSDRKSTRLNSSHGYISYAVFCLKKKNRLSTVASKAEPCEDDVVAHLTALRRKYAEFILRHGDISEEELFSAEQNVQLVMTAGRY